MQNPPSTATYRTTGAYCSALPTPAHCHIVELSRQQLETLNNGGVVTVTTSQPAPPGGGPPYMPDTGAHTHTFTIKK